MHQDSIARIPTELGEKHEVPFNRLCPISIASHFSSHCKNQMWILQIAPLRALHDLATLPFEGGVSNLIVHHSRCTSLSWVASPPVQGHMPKNQKFVHHRLAVAWGRHREMLCSRSELPRSHCHVSRCRWGTFQGSSCSNNGPKNFGLCKILEFH
jgi:hypothetical protein